MVDDLRQDEERQQMSTRWRASIVVVCVGAIALGALSGCGSLSAPEQGVTGTTQLPVVVPQTVTVSVPSSVDIRKVAAGASASLSVADRAQIQGTTAGTFALSTST